MSWLQKSVVTVTIVEQELFDAAVKLSQKGVPKDVITPSVNKDATAHVNVFVHPGVQLTAEKSQVEHLPVAVVDLADLVRWVVDKTQ
jgi:hypothetical protein